MSLAVNTLEGLLYKHLAEYRFLSELDAGEDTTHWFAISFKTLTSDGECVVDLK